MKNNIDEINQDEEKQLKNDKKKEIIKEILNLIREENPDFYYMPTTEVATEVNRFIKESGKLSREKMELLKDLKDYDIQILMSINTKMI